MQGVVVQGQGVQQGQGGKGVLEIPNKISMIFLKINKLIKLPGALTPACCGTATARAGLEVRREPRRTRSAGSCEPGGRKIQILKLINRFISGVAK